MLKRSVVGDDMEMQQIILPHLISEGMVLQQNQSVTLWGKGLGCSAVQVEILENETCIMHKTANVNKTNWKLQLDPMKAGGPYQIQFFSDHKIDKILKNVYVGEVWVCAGQSNMELPIRRVADQYPEALSPKEEDNIYLFKVPEQAEFQVPCEDTAGGVWQKPNAENIAEMSSISFFLAELMHRDKKIPIGIINISLGGAPIEAWMDQDSLQVFPNEIALLKQYRNSDFVARKKVQDEQNRMVWQSRLPHDFQPQNKKKIHLPNSFAGTELEGKNGVIWLHRKFDVSPKLIKKELKLWLGTMVDSDETYINGVCVGRTEYQYPPRKYSIPKGLLKEKDNQIVIRLVVEHGQGRITRGKKFEIFEPNKKEVSSVKLEGNWYFEIGYTCMEAPVSDFISWKPSALYNGMLSPCLNYTIKGVVWYQGESNDKNPTCYLEHLERMIALWRGGFGMVPFVIVQLPGCDIDIAPDLDAWPMIRMAQQHVEGNMIAVTVNLDRGEYNDLHPTDKKRMAERIFEATQYLDGRMIAYGGPRLESKENKTEEIILYFSNCNGKLKRSFHQQALDNPELLEEWKGEKTQTENMCELQACDEKGVYWYPEIRLEKNQIHIKKGVQKIKKIRYGWCNFPYRGLLYDENEKTVRPFEIQIEG